MTRQRAYLNNDPQIRHAIAAVAMATRRAEDITRAGTHQLTDVERADLTDAITRLTRLASQP